MTSPIKTTVPIYRPSIPQGWKEQLESVVESRWWGYGPRCHALEREFVNVREGWSLATNSCTAALYLIGRFLTTTNASRREIIVPAMTFVSTAMALREAGLIVRLADVDPSTLLLDPESAASLINENTIGVVAVHLYGQLQDLTRLRELCDTNNLYLIEDCAHRLDARSEPSVADFACFSFNAVKEATGGEGGMLWGRAPDQEVLCRNISNLGMDMDTLYRSSSLVHSSYGFSEHGGLKLRYSDFSAAFVQSCLVEFQSWHIARTRIVERYNNAFLPLMRISIQPRNLSNDSCLMYVVRVPEVSRNRVRQSLAEKGIATSLHYPSLSEHPLFGGFSCPEAERASRELVTLPCYPELSAEDQGRVIDAIREAVRADQ